MKMAVFWDVAQCGLVEIDKRFRGDNTSRLRNNRPILLINIAVGLLSISKANKLPYLTHQLLNDLKLVFTLGFSLR
jgi:hypothetical protein